MNCIDHLETIRRKCGSGENKGVRGMIDVHNHLLYGVDDGAGGKEESVAMLYEAAEQGISAIILTPHYRYGMFPYPKKEIEAHYRELVPYARELGIRLCLGTEYHVNSEMINGFLTENYHTLADSNYILTEYSHHDEFAYVKKMTEDTLFFGFIPVIAHVERYEFAGENPENVAQLRDLGAMIQINADAVLGLDGHPAKKLCRVLLRKGLVDMIASDSHGISERACHMRQCYEFVEKKYGVETAEKLFITNPAQVLEQSTEFSQDVRFFREKRGGEQQTVHVLRESAHA